MISFVYCFIVNNLYLYFDEKKILFNYIIIIVKIKMRKMFFFNFIWFYMYYSYMFNYLIRMCLKKKLNL